MIKGCIIKKPQQFQPFPSFTFIKRFFSFVKFKKLDFYLITKDLHLAVRIRDLCVYGLTGVKWDLKKSRNESAL